MNDLNSESTPDRSGSCPNLEPLERSGYREGQIISHGYCTGKISLGNGAYKKHAPAAE